MIYYIDFDSTLYKTSSLKNKMLESIAKKCCNENKNINFESVLFEAISMFKREKIYNIYKLCEYFAEKYKIDAECMKNEINNILKNGKHFVYCDVKKFLTKLKKENNILILLTYSAKQDFDYQKLKIEGSGLTKYFDEIIITSKLKYALKNVDYKNGIFIDDNPNDLLGIAKHNPIKIYRMKRQDNKYSKIEIENKDIIEIENFEKLTNYKTKILEC